MMDKVFVYGTLKVGYGNHHFLQDSECLGKDSLHGFTMYSLGPFPCIVDDVYDGVVHGEVYQVDGDTFRSLDMLEGYPNFYNRKKVKTAANRDVWVYYHEESPGTSVVEGGEW